MATFLAASLLVLLGSANPAPGEAVGRLEKLVPRVMREADVPGVSVALVRGGRVVWHRGFGVRNVETRAPVVDQTVFEAASLSKPVFAYAVMKLVDAGKLSLDEPLVKYLGGSPLPEDERASRITARMALAHTTGFPNEVIGRPLAIHFTPGSRFSYSGVGFQVLQDAVERITGERVEPFVRRTVFEPLGMTSSSFVWQDRYAALRATGYSPGGAAARDRRPGEGKAASTLLTTSLDYARFLAAVLTGTGLTKESSRRMLETQVPLDESCLMCLDRPPQKLSATLSWGLGWGLERAENGPAIWQWGDNNGEFQSFVIGYPGTKTGVVVLTNSGNGLSIVPAIVSAAVGGKHPLFAWLPYEPYDSPLYVVYRDVLKGGAAAIRRYRDARKSSSGVRLTERQTNDLGYRLLAKKKNAEALEVFRINVEDYPDSWNAHDSLGEAYLALGQGEPAIRSYRRSLVLNPANANARNVLKQLKAE